MPKKNEYVVPIHRLEALTVQQAADLLGVNRMTLYPYVSSGKLESYRMGRRRLISRDALNHFQTQMTAEHVHEMTALPTSPAPRSNGKLPNKQKPR